MTRVCKPGGTVLLQDLDGQLLWHYPEDAEVQQTAEKVVAALAATGFDPFVGRKLFWLAKKAGLTCGFLAGPASKGLGAAGPRPAAVGAEAGSCPSIGKDRRPAAPVDLV